MLSLNGSFWSFQNAQTYVCTVVAFHCIAVLFGAPFFTQIHCTAGFAMLMASLIVIPMMRTRELALMDMLEILFGERQFFSDKLNRDQLRALLTIVGAWLGAFVIPLDWDRPWQEWPIPCCVGAVLGTTVFYLHMYVKGFLPSRLSKRL